LNQHPSLFCCHFVQVSSFAFDAKAFNSFSKFSWVNNCSAGGGAFAGFGGFDAAWRAMMGSEGMTLVMDDATRDEEMNVTRRQGTKGALGNKQ